MIFHHKINKAHGSHCDRHTFRIDSTLQVEDKIFHDVAFFRAGLPERILESFLKLSALNEEFLMDRIKRHNLRQFERIQHPVMEPIMDITA